MGNKNLPQVMSEKLIETQQMITRITRLGDARHEVRDEVRASTDRLIDALTKNTGVMMERLMRHDNQLRDHDGRLSSLENPPR